jgi:hypothetical protein
MGLSSPLRQGSRRLVGPDRPPLGFAPAWGVLVEAWTFWRPSHRSARDLPGPRHVRVHGRFSRRPVRDRTPTLGFSNTAPPSFISREVSPAGVSADLGPVLPHTVRVPPTWSLTTSTACSLGARAGLLHPATDPGVHRVSAPRRGVCIRLPVCARSVSCLLSDARPSALFPRVQPRRRHRRLLPPRRCPTCLPTRPRGLAPHPRP